MNRFKFFLSDKYEEIIDRLSRELNIALKESKELKEEVQKPKEVIQRTQIKENIGTFNKEVKVDKSKLKLKYGLEADVTNMIIKGDIIKIQFKKNTNDIQTVIGRVIDIEEYDIFEEKQKHNFKLDCSNNYIGATFSSSNVNILNITNLKDGANVKPMLDVDIETTFINSIHGIYQFKKRLKTRELKDCSIKTGYFMEDVFIREGGLYDFKTIEGKCFRGVIEGIYGADGNNQMTIDTSKPFRQSFEMVLFEELESITRIK